MEAAGIAGPVVRSSSLSVESKKTELERRANRPFVGVRVLQC
jgi:hypothetical protein